jgi:hypothetical protein
MASVHVMWSFFEMIDSCIMELAQGDPEKKELLDRLVFEMLCIFDGVSSPDSDWNGIVLVATDELPDGVEEINDDFLHDAWSYRNE